MRAPRVLLFTLLVTGASVETAGAQTERDALVAAKQRLLDANYRNDRDSMFAVLADLERLSQNDRLAFSARYHLGFGRWLLSASQLAAGDTAAARAALREAYAALERAVGQRPDDADVRAMLVWTLVSTVMADPERRPQLFPELVEHRRRALELGPRNPRVAMMDAGILFYTPAGAGGGADRGLSRGRDALELLEDERIEDSLAPDWGGALLYGWLANLYLQANPPRRDEAGVLARRALTMRPDFWWLRTQVIPLIAAP